MRYLIKFSYDGSCFSGLERQKDKKTVQGEIEKQLTKLNKTKVDIHASGRTDKGVHAKMQYAHFDLDKDIKEYNLKKYLNNSLNKEIYIESIQKKDNNFHARYNVKTKTYSYYINAGTFNPCKHKYEYQYCKPLDIEKMKRSAKILLGEHDFRSFCTGEKNKANCIRTIYDINITEKQNIIKITIKGNGFLRKMIRNIVALLIEIGANKKEEAYLDQILKQKSRLGNLKCAPPEGLYLEEVTYN